MSEQPIKQPASKGLLDEDAAWAALQRWREGIEATLRERIAELERERDEARKCIAALEESIDNARVAAQQRTARIAELEAILHDAPTIVEIETHAPGWLGRVRAAQQRTARIAELEREVKRLAALVKEADRG